MAHTVSTASNTRTGLAVGRFEVVAEMEAFDRLPPLLRQALASATVKGAALEAEPLVSLGLSVGDLLAMLREGERRDLALFGSQYQRRHGASLPHIAAGASILRP